MFKNDVVYSDKSNKGVMKPNPIGLLANRGKLGHASSYKTNEEVTAEISTKVQAIYMLEQQIKTKEMMLKDLDSQLKKQLFFSWFRIPNWAHKIISFIKHPPTLSFNNIKTYFRGEKSSIQEGTVSLTVLEKRKNICSECPHREHFPGYTDELGFCTKCGCGANPKSQLTNKIKIPKVSCPIGKWGEESGTRGGLWGQIRYIITRKHKNVNLS